MILESPIVMILAYVTSIAFSAVAAMVPPNAGNLVGAIFMASFASYVGGEETPDEYERELEDADI